MLLKQCFAVCAILSLSSNVIAQSPINQWNIWHFGANGTPVTLDFNSGAPVAVNNSSINAGEGCSVMCDSMGNNMLYSNGTNVWNKNHAGMTNGGGLLGQTSSTQSSVIVPKPGSNSIYYVFTTGASAANHDLMYSEVDMTMSGGLGAVTANKNILLVGNIGEKLTAVRQSNNTDYWVITHGIGNNNFYAYSVTSAGVNATPVISSVGSSYTGQYGNMKVSYNGCKIAAINRGTGTEFVQVFDFDNATGVVSNPFYYEAVGGAPYGLEFSPNSELLYVSDYISPNRKVIQYDLSSGVQATIFASKYFAYFGGNWVATPQMGPDGKIYVAKVLQQNIDVIQNPDVAGAGCNYTIDGQNLGGRSSWFGLPQRIPGLESDFSWTSTICDDPYNFSVIDTFPSPMDGVEWNFGDPASGVNNTSTDRNPTHTFSAEGTYTVQLITTLCNWKDTTEYVINCSNTVLPVELTHFEAKKEGDIVGLYWETMSEKNNDYFLIEKSGNAEDNWSFVGKVEGKGTTTSKSNYRLPDLKPYQGWSYYRLTQVDLNGQKRVYPVRSVYFNNDMLVYPNPAKEELFVKALSYEDVTIIDGFGKQIQNLPYEEKNDVVSFDIRSLADGVYIVRVGNLFEKIIVKR